MKKRDLVQKHNNKNISDEEKILLEKYIQNGDVDISELRDIDELHQAIDVEQIEIPSQNLRQRFFQTLEEEKAKQSSSSVTLNLSFLQSFLQHKFAFGISMLLVGAICSWLILRTNVQQPQIQQLSNELSEMRELMMLSMLEKESTTERIKAVNLTREMPEVSSKVTEALFHTLNQDENINVRLATIEALLPYTNQAKVREGLINSIQYQDSPLVQITLAEVMVALQEKRSVEELRALLQTKEVPKEVKERIEKSIEVLL